jgi:hypothetical protein
VSFVEGSIVDAEVIFRLEEILNVCRWPPKNFADCDNALIGQISLLS